VESLDKSGDEVQEAPLLGQGVPSPKRIEEAENDMRDINVRGDDEFNTKMNVVSGLIRDEEQHRMLRLLYRVSRGKVAAFFKDIGPNRSDFEDPGENAPRGTVFVLVFEDTTQLEVKVLKICQSFTQHTYVMPKGFTREMRRRKIVDLQSEIKSSKDLLLKTRLRLREYFQAIQHISAENVSESLRNSFSGEMDLFTLYKVFLEREKLVYSTFNKMKIDGGPLVTGFAWIPSRSVNTVMATITDLKDSNPQNLDAPRLVKLNPSDYMDISPPTLFLTNEFTGVFQMITDQYDVPRYKEINPTLFACVTFPFLFGMMYGDICHGMVVLVFGVLLCLIHYLTIESKGL